MDLKKMQDELPAWNVELNGKPAEGVDVFEHVVTHAMKAVGHLAALLDDVGHAVSVGQHGEPAVIDPAGAFAGASCRPSRSRFTHVAAFNNLVYACDDTGQVWTRDGIQHCWVHAGIRISAVSWVPILEDTAICETPPGVTTQRTTSAIWTVVQALVCAPKWDSPAWWRDLTNVLHEAGYVTRFELQKADDEVRELRQEVARLTAALEQRKVTTPMAATAAAAKSAVIYIATVGGRLFVKDVDGDVSIWNGTPGAMRWDRVIGVPLIEWVPLVEWVPLSAETDASLKLRDEVARLTTALEERRKEVKDLREYITAKAQHQAALVAYREAACEAVGSTTEATADVLAKAHKVLRETGEKYRAAAAAANMEV